MHKKKLIKKYQFPSSGLQIATDPFAQYKNYKPKTLGENLIGDVTSGFANQLQVTSGIQPTNNSLVTSQPRNTNTIQSLVSKPIKPIKSLFASGVSDASKTNRLVGGNLATKQLSGFMKGINKIGPQIVGEAPAAIEAGIKMFGGQEAETATGAEKVFQSATTGAFKTALQTGNPLAIAITGGLKGLDMLNRYAGSTAESQKTTGIDTGGYATQLSPNAGKKQTLLGSIGWRGKGTSKTANINKQTARADRSNILASQGAYQGKQNLLAAQNTYGDIATRNQQQLFGGINPNILSAKTGAKINPKKLSNIKKRAQRKVAKAQEGSEIDDGQKFALGGKINVIPDGALHAHKNNYEGELAEQVTAKGIPVITYEEDGKITQHAEIEHSEIIFHKDVTTQLEEWFKEYTDTEDSTLKKELELKCGKFLTEEILENTQDNVGLIETI